MCPSFYVSNLQPVSCVCNIISWYRDAWNHLGDMSAEDAMHNYVEELKQVLGRFFSTLTQIPVPKIWYTTVYKTVTFMYIIRSVDKTREFIHHKHLFGSPYCETFVRSVQWTSSDWLLTEQSGWKSHNKENQTSVCDEWTRSFCYPTNMTKLMNVFGY